MVGRLWRVGCIALISRFAFFLFLFLFCAVQCGGGWVDPTDGCVGWMEGMEGSESEDSDGMYVYDRQVYIYI